MEQIKLNMMYEKIYNNSDKKLNNIQYDISGEYNNINNKSNENMDSYREIYNDTNFENIKIRNKKIENKSKKKKKNKTLCIW